MTEQILIPRHSVSDRLMHWSNALLWFLLLFTGIALVDHPQLAILGRAYPAFVRDMAGGGANLLHIHIALGAVWVASFLIYLVVNAKGALFFLRSIFRPQKGDIIWLMRKGAHMTLGRDISRRLGVSLELPPQGYYNAGQRVLAVAIVLGCVAIAASGFFMAVSRFIPEAHYPWLVPGMVSWALLAHHASVWLIVAGLFVHIYMAAISSEERPALFSMFSGTVPMGYARHHHPLWDTASVDNSSQKTVH